MEQKSFFSLLPEESLDIIHEFDTGKFRLKQFYQWVYEKYVTDISLMTNLSLDFRNKIKDRIGFQLPEVETEFKSKDESSKYLLKLHDNSHIEMVIMPGEGKNTVCISSQVGCSRKCTFCATGTMGLRRNLFVDEIVGQVYLAKKLLLPGSLTNIVFMGMGEPLDNYDNLIKAIQIIESDPGMKFSPRHITVSTCGVIPNIRRLGNSGIKVKLAVSLNSAIEEIRNKIMPVNRVYSLNELKKSLLDFRKRTTFRITYEYIMIPEFNMSDADIKAIYKFLGDQSCKLNLIAFNPVKGLPYRSPEPSEIERFMNSLNDLKIAVILRKSRGSDVSAACGQLAAGYTNKN
ncbi:MAG TPA: 23S rRNA (adenine(2503)-C(2))-methyltransferase RlmN [Candidatus Cloacimonadota bacterium]|nr:23S rRNA (adenine(2503)-C(2))-methyltransferase RlmN [Candidatus Cloacimonadota bacterium]HPT71099.1 23S rRNA (adenine(2503)-C(2))-methyltransferase RlmN [Candidatus Cloacimonadota bacterium]